MDDYYHGRVIWSEHPRWREWAEPYKTKAMLLGVPVSSIGWSSFTFAINGGSCDADTLEPVDWRKRYNEVYGRKQFLKWLKDNG